MIKRIVISLEILVIEMGDRGSKSVIFGRTYLPQSDRGYESSIIVKEQRVDGSSIIFN